MLTPKGYLIYMVHPIAKTKSSQVMSYSREPTLHYVETCEGHEASINMSVVGIEKEI